ncbi:OmpA/MotB family protein [Pseudobacteriovorax antillogorgiicola]|uniref:Chemotaxis protein MotB n=1 Tax=Pseudobacteriovorax antillogorgiicola TaxID=1513793 RepID=A0A1Y6C220_9BACT|nr:OmpA family protein [Pseudobacteriovorax antillogorgiicola]TCS50222.1 chemotaxis protein MotB [Pseudobacteriovorax antillogorgiicola]SMF32588.1 chemotaxis protein MotB [Pseudobacteriovorax antillogorgiicola]
MGELEGIKKAKTKKSEALWMMTFADLSFILMCFFALLISFSKPNKQKFDNVVNGMVQTPKYQTKKEDGLKELAQKIKKEIKKRKLEKSAQVKLDADGLAIELKDRLVFRPGSAKPSRSLQREASKVMKIISKSPEKYKITIEGHTDDTPLIGHRKYASNWDLSAARGISLLNHFAGKGVQRSRMRVVAYADTKPKVAISGRKGEALRRARASNRRVVIRID